MNLRMAAALFWLQKFLQRENAATAFRF